MTRRFLWPLGGLLAMLILAASFSNTPAQRGPVMPFVGGSQVGRFVVAQTGDDRGAKYIVILDTTSGKLYKATEKDFQKYSDLPKPEPREPRQPFDFEKDKAKDGPAKDREKDKDVSPKDRERPKDDPAKDKRKDGDGKRDDDPDRRRQLEELKKERDELKRQAEEAKRQAEEALKRSEAELERARAEADLARKRALEEERRAKEEAEKRKREKKEQGQKNP